MLFLGSGNLGQLTFGVVLELRHAGCHGKAVTADLAFSYLYKKRKGGSADGYLIGKVPISNRNKPATAKVIPIPR